MESPFPHFLKKDVLPLELVSDLLDWLDLEAPWYLVETDFYEQHEFSLHDVNLPPYLSPLTERQSITDLVKKVGDAFSLLLKEEIEITGHKLESGQSIRIHNDVLEEGPTHRLIIQLNRNWCIEDGGFLVFFGSDDAADIRSVIKPVNNTAVGFEVSDFSNHAVSRINRGKRYSLVYSFEAS